MIRFTNTIHINRPIEEVFAYISDFEHTPEWNWAITETSKMTPGTTAVGTRYRQTRSVPQLGVEVLEVTALETAHRVEVQGTLGQFPAHLSYHLHEMDGGTHLTNTVSLEAQGAVRLLTPVLGNRIKRAVADNLKVLKARLEVEPGPRAATSSPRATAGDSP